MLCQSCDRNPDGAGFIPCSEESILTIWCPTWTKCEEGPRLFCQRHADLFDPTKNTNALDGQFFYGDDAQQAFKEIEAIFPRNDERYINSRGMLEHVPNRSHVAGKENVGFMSYGLFVCDGKLWLLTFWHVMRIGNYHDVKDRYAKLLAIPKK
jgi:hypothetical protein